MRRCCFKDLDRSPICFLCVLGFCFLFIFLLNEMTPYVGDDWIYTCSFETGERLETFSDIIPSMYRHAFTMNGRILPHALEQFFLLLPKHFFNICSSVIFVWVMYSMYSVCNVGRERSTLLFLVVVMSFWNYVPAFGQVCLWQVGTINYLWAIGLCMIYLRPYLVLYFGETEAPYFRSTRRLWAKLLFILSALLFGMYSEITSVVGIVLSVGIFLASPRERQRESLWLFIPIAAAAAGSLFLFSMPAEQRRKGIWTLAEILKQVPDLTLQLKECLSVLFIAWAVLMTLSFVPTRGENKSPVSPSKRLASLGFFLGALAACYITVFSVSLPYRCMITSTVFLILACGVLLSELLSFSYAASCKAAIAVLTLAFSVNLICGVGDIGSAWRQQRMREAQIAQALDNGETEITLSRIYFSTKYSPFSEMKDLDRDYPDAWPNPFIAKYYGFEKVYGTNPVVPD